MAPFFIFKYLLDTEFVIKFRLTERKRLGGIALQQKKNYVQDNNISYYLRMSKYLTLTDFEILSMLISIGNNDARMLVLFLIWFDLIYCLTDNKSNNKKIIFLKFFLLWIQSTDIIIIASWKDIFNEEKNDVLWCCSSE